MKTEGTGTFMENTEAVKLKSPVQVLLELSGSWDDERTTEEIIMDIKRDRKDSKKLEMGF